MKYSKKEYEEALNIVEAYERQQEEEKYSYENLCDWKASQEVYEYEEYYYGMLLDDFEEYFFA